ncbi:hypothetical protein DCC79_03595 [bacterium]|nr:MAG: hypothetical protein DCC79_03595 [bacterium]
MSHLPPARPAVLYRPWQLAAALRSRRHPPDAAVAAAILPPGLAPLFDAMAPEDRRHALRVVAALAARGEAAPVLLQAALLHDVGKANGGVHLRHRVARVLLSRLWPAAWVWLSASPTGWRRPFWILAWHPARGAEWIAAAGGGAELAALVRHHESAPPAAWAGTEMQRWHAALKWADARS